MKNSKKILIIGGAGYIGSVVTKNILDAGYQATVLDDLSRGKKNMVDSRADFVQLNVLNRDNFFDFLSKYNFYAVIYLAAHKDAGASMEDAVKYSENIRGLINVLDGLVKFNISKIIYSSSAAVYGNPQYLPMDEKHPLNPVSYYGFTKLESERIIFWYHKIHDLSYVNLRYFNAVGDAGFHYQDPAASNLFPIIQEVLTGKRKNLEIYGNDWDTRDGTCLRDYIHVADLAKAHVLALDYEKSDIFNLGADQGQTVLEVIDEFSRQFGQNIAYVIKNRRSGDPEAVIASSVKAQKLLGFKPEKKLADIVSSLKY